MEAKKFIDIRKLIGSKNPTLLRWLPNFVIKYLERILHQDEINQFLIDHPTQKNEEFCRAAIRFFNITIEIEGLENIPQSGGVTLAMNHPLGGMDAIALVDAISSKRTDLKFIVNDLLLNLEGMKGMFVGVNKHGKTNESIHQKIDELFHSDKAVCIFPAGMVSRKQKGLVRDLEWKKTFVMLSKRANHPIVPIYIDGKLSNFFYRLSNFRKFIGIKANIEMLYLSDELFKQKNVTMKFRVGKPITPEMLDESKSHREWAQWIRNSVYELEKDTKK
jgi:1-acyl-sn-glycerol-3-phosphate acyltransferase